jgi:hypothetical protein
MYPPREISPAFKVIFGMVTIMTLFNVWLLKNMVQHQCARVDLGVIRISIGAMCPLSAGSQLERQQEPEGAMERLKAAAVR